MRDPNRIAETMDLLMDVWEANPDWRLGQVIENAKRYANKRGVDTFYLEDDEMFEGLMALAQYHGLRD